MTRFSIPETAFSGYRLLASRPGAALVWFAFSLAVVLGLGWLTAVLAGPELAALKEMQASGAPDPATAMALSRKVMPISALGLLVALVSGAILVGAVARAVLRPAQGALAYLRFGADEFRLMAVLLVVAILLLIPVILAWIPATIAMFATAGPQVAAMAMQGHGELPLTAKLAACAAAVPGVLVFLFLFVKLSLASAQTVAERSIRIFNSWTLTKGVFWRTLWTYALAAIPLAVLKLIVLGVAAALNPDVGFKLMPQPDMSSVEAVFSGPQVAVLALQALFQTIQTAALLAPAAMIYLALTGRTPETAVSADDEDDDDED
jgi:hypothetical protein